MRDCLSPCAPQPRAPERPIIKRAEAQREPSSQPLAGIDSGRGRARGLSGRSAIATALLATAKPYAFVELDDESALVIDLFRRARELGKADAAVLTFKDGLLWRCEYHVTIDAFRAGLPAESDHWLNPDREGTPPFSA